MTQNSVAAALDQFVKSLLEKQLNEASRLPLTPFDEEWPSPCYQQTEGTLREWKPVHQNAPNTMFDRLEEALEFQIHPDVAAFYSHYWSDPLPASCTDGDLSLIQVWSSEDMERLRSNILGHLLMKKKFRQPLTVFIACPEPDDNYMISVINDNGEVWLEQPGKPPIRKLADNLAEFISSLTPRVIEDQE